MSPPAWHGRRVLVAGVGLSGAAAARALLRFGASVRVVDDGADDAKRERAAELTALGAEVRLGDAALSGAVDLVVTSPGWRPDHPLLSAADGAGVPVWGEVELAWQMRPPEAAPWLTLTGTNGKTTTVGMLTAMLRAAGRRAVAAGNVGTPLIDVVLALPPFEVIAVELSSFQLHWSSSLRPLATALLNLAPDHLDWHGGFAEYAAAKTLVWSGAVNVGNADDPLVAERLVDAPGRRVEFTLKPPGEGQLGVADGRLLDRAFGPADGAGVAMAATDRVRPVGPHNVANALAAAALARAYGVPAEAVGAGLAAYRPARHRNEPVATVAGVAYVDDSKATNPHAAAASLGAYPCVVWIAGGLDKGLRFDELVRDAAPRLRAAVLLGKCRPLLMAAFARHAPKVPVLEVRTSDTSAMTEAVRLAAGAARPGDTVLLAPAAASMDIFRDYQHRGDEFAAAVRRLAGEDA